MSDGVVTEDTLLDLIDGKTLSEFTIAAINLPLPTDLRDRLLNADDLIPDWIARGLVTTDGNTYTKV